MSNSKENNYVDFDSLQQMLGLNDMTLFLSYLKEVFKDLSERSEDIIKKGVNKVTFYDYVKLPILIADKLFSALDIDQDGFLNSNEFIIGLQDLYMGDFDSSLDLIFKLLDFDKDGKITKEDTKVILSYLPIKTDNTQIEYKFQMQSLNEIDEILDKTFGEKNKITKEEFSKIVENNQSDVYLQILCFLYQKKPFKSQNIRPLKASKKKFNFNIKEKISSPNLSSGFQKEHLKKKIITPSKKTTLSSAEAFLSASQLKEDILGTSNKSSFNNINNSPLISGINGMIRMNNKLILNENEKKNIINNKNDVVKNSKKVLNSPSLFFKALNNKKNELDNFDIATDLIKKGNLNLDFESNSSSDDENDNKKNKKNKKKKENKNEEKEEILYGNWVYKISSSNKLIKYFLVIINKDIFYYKTDKKEELLGMHNLSGCYIKPNGEKAINGSKLYCFQIIFPSKHRNYYTSTRKIAEEFVLNLKKGIGYLNFFDFYEMVDDIGEGKFGLIKLGLHKSTHQRVAIKIIKKYQMKDNDIELVKSEIDIMKLCHHPNVVRLLDHFENAEYIFIVMEYLSGGSLKNYLNKKRFNFSEKRAAEIIFQIGLGIQYLHQYGIVHRDLKPDNIMLTENENMSQIKIMDFGLSKIMGPKEHVIDGFGTLSFVAPEVLVRTPYNKEVDIWSIGVILFYMLSGILPFDDVSDDEELIAKMIVFNDCEFENNIWKKRSNDVVDLIKKCLVKNPQKRIKIDDFLNHQWFKEFKLGKEDVLEKDVEDEMKREQDLNLNNQNQNN